MYRSRIKQNLRKYQCLVSETATPSIYFGIDEIPNELTSGKNFFKIAGSEFLRTDVPLKVEIVDAAGTALYYDITSYLDELNRRVISIWVTPNIVKGVAYVTIIGEITKYFDGSMIPTDWVNRYNLKLNVPILIDPTKPNTSDILFEDSPRVYITGFKTVGKEISPLSVTFRQEFLTQSNGYVSFKTIPIDSFYGNQRSSIQTYEHQQSKIWSQVSIDDTNNNSATISTRNVKVRKNNRYITNGWENQVPNTRYQLYSPSGLFVPNMIGGVIHIPNPSNVFPSTGSYAFLAGTSAYIKAQIADVVNNKIAYLAAPIIYNLSGSDRNVTHIVEQFDPSTYCVSYSFSNSDIQYLTSSTVPSTNVEVQIGNLNPITGDIHRIKILAKRRNLDQHYNTVYDNIIQPEELLADPFYPNQTTFREINTNKRLTGIFYVTSDLTKYWITSSYGVDAKARPFRVNSDSCSNAAQCFPFTLNIGSTQTNQFDPHTILKYSGSFYCLEQSSISLKFRAYCCYDSESMSYPSIEIFASGSSFLPQQTSVGTQWGKLIGSIDINERGRLFDELEFPIIADRDGSGTIIFKIKGGQWFFTNISVKPTEYNGFTPDNIKLQLQLPYDISSSVDFKLEYYDITGKQAQYITYVNNFLLKTTYYSKQYTNANNEIKQPDVLFNVDSRIAPNTDILHQYNLQRNLVVTDGIIESLRKSDIYTREAYINLISNNSSSRPLVADDNPTAPPRD